MFIFFNQKTLRLLNKIMKDVIKFYREGDEYGYFSNFSKHPVTIDGKEWKTTGNLKKYKNRALFPSKKI